MATQQRHVGACWVLALAGLSCACKQLFRPAFVDGAAGLRRHPRPVRTARWQQIGDFQRGFDPMPRRPMKNDGFTDADLEPLDEKQLEALNAVLEGDNVFITGGAGTGKSRTLRAIVEELHSKFQEGFKDKVAVTATTGTAAINVGGCTLHHLAGLKVPNEVRDFNKVGQGVYKKIWQQLEVVVIDEASMLSGEFLDRLDEVVRKLRDERPLQWVLVGDLYQLPPIMNKVDAQAFVELDPDLLKENRAVKKVGPRATWEYFLNRGMLFQSSSFWRREFRVVKLTTQHRQQRDATLAECLRNLRKSYSEISVRTINTHCYWPFEARREDATLLVPTVAQVNTINAQRLALIAGEDRKFVAKDDVVVGPPPPNKSAEEAAEWSVQAEALLRGSSFFQDGEVPQVVSFKVGALVMLSSTIDQRLDLVNGQTGQVVGLSHRRVDVLFTGLGSKYSVEAHKFEYTLPGVGKCIREQFPLRLAWAITHHRSQGKTLSNVVVDPKSFTWGQAYVALSRARGMEGLRLLRPLRTADIRMNPTVSTFERVLKNGTEPQAAQKELKTWRELPVTRTRKR